MASPDVLLKALAACVCVAVGLVSVAESRKMPLRALSAFLLLIGVNQGAEAVRAATQSADVAVICYRIASIAAALDPLILSWMILALAPGGARHDRAWLASTAVASAALALWAGFALMPVDDLWFWLAISVYTAIVYVALLFRVARAAQDREPPGGAWLVAALTLVAVAAAQRVVDPFMHGSMSQLSAWGLPPNYITVLAPALVVAGGVSFALLRSVASAPASVARAARWACAGALALTLVARARLIVLSIDPSELTWASALEVLGRAETSARWLCFAALATGALARSGGLSVSLAQRRRAARVMIGLALIVALVVGDVALSALAGRVVSVFELAVVPLVALASQSFRRLVDIAALRLYRVPVPGDAVAAQEAYRAAALDVTARGGVASRDARLQRLREDLAIDIAVATVIERVAEETVSAPLRPGILVAERYHVDRLLGRGGSGRVFLADDLRLQRKVVLKEVFLDAAAAGAALREGRLASAVQHERVAAIYDAIPRGDSLVLVQEYVAGGTLRDAMARGLLAPEDRVRIARGLLEGAAAIHAAGVTHADLKPENVLLTPAREPKVVDFGVARAAQATTAPVGRPLGGTLGYSSPEQLLGERPTHASDVWALGVIARELLGDPAPAAWEPVIARALSREPAGRWQDAREMLAAAPQLQ